MHNWSTDTKSLKKDQEKYTIWRLEQMVNFGLGGEKLKEKELRKFWPQLALDPARKNLLKFLLNGAQANA